MRADRKPRKGWTKIPRLIHTLGVGKTTKAVLIALLSYADKHGACWPSQESLRRDVSGSRRGVQRALNALEGKAVKSSAHPPLVPPAIGRKRELGPGGVRRYVVAPWVLNADTSLGARVRHPDAAPATSGTEDSTGASRRREGCIPRAQGVRPSDAQNENDGTRTTEREAAGADSEQGPRNAKEARLAYEAILAEMEKKAGAVPAIGRGASSGRPERRGATANSEQAESVGDVLPRLRSPAVIPDEA